MLCQRSIQWFTFQILSRNKVLLLRPLPDLTPCSSRDLSSCTINTNACTSNPIANSTGKQVLPQIDEKTKRKNSGKYNIEMNSFFIACDQNHVSSNRNLPEYKNTGLDYHCSKLVHGNENLQDQLNSSVVNGNECNAFSTETKQTEAGTIVIPLVWQENNSLLSQNFNPSKKALINFKNRVFKNQGTLEKIDVDPSQSEGAIKTTHEVVELEQRTEFLNNRCFRSGRPKRKAAAASSSRNRVLAARNLI